MKRLEIDYETADRITLLNLEEYRNDLRVELQNHKEFGVWMHPDDVAATPAVLEALTLIIHQFGGE